jgi:predicted pyridoxine 5'-phosphate oxidase superfamily flavin-nucleotide-binding protein
MSDNAYHTIAFTPFVLSLQEEGGSRAAYARAGSRGGGNGRLGDPERLFIAERDGFFIASVSETGWPYVQFRGGPPGFVQTPDPETIAWADFRGNQQFITAGNILGDERVSLFFMDYAGRRRLKVFGALSFCDAADQPALAERLAVPGYRARVDRVALLRVAAWDRNCPQHIPQRFTLSELGLPSDHPLPPVPRASSR